MAENEKQKDARRKSPIQAFVLIFCVTGTIGLAAALAVFARDYSENEANIAGRVVVLRGVEPPNEKASPRAVELWIGKYEKATPGCVCALGRSKAAADADTAMMLCVGFMKGRGGSRACEMKPENLPAGVTMHVSPRGELSRHQKIVFLLSRIFSKRIVSSRTGQM
ncbi:MAG: hypothetical protein WCX65_13600 [bacterium]